MRRSLPTIRSTAALPFALAVLSAAAAGQSTVPIHSIMSGLPNSPYLGQSVSVSGVVVGVMSSGGFYITAPNSAWDTSTATAEGIQIYAAAANPPCAVVGNLVTVTGTVANGTAQNGALTPGTGITPTSCTVTGTGSVSNTETLATASAYAQDLPYTGVPITNTLFYAVSPTSGTASAATGLVTSTGQFWSDFVLPANNHLFKSAGLELDNFYPPPPAPTSGIPTWSGNPQRLLVDTATFGGPPIDIAVGQSLRCSVPAGLTLGATAGIGVIDYSLGYNRLLLFASTVCTVSGTIAPSVTAPADTSHFHVATLNLNLFHSLANSPTPALYQTRLAKAALAIVNVLGRPDILSIQQVEDLPTLQAIGDAATALAGPGTTYQAYWLPPNDPTQLGLGFLLNTQAVTAARPPYQVNVSDTFTRTDGTSVPLFERPPFVIDAELLRAGLNYLLTVVNIELTPRDNIDDPVNGPNVWERRGQQAVALSKFANSEQKSQINLIIAGEFNAYSFSDGFVDPTDIIDGAAVPAPGTVAQYEPSSTSNPMFNFVGDLASGTIYNIIENGNARSVEHILCSETQSLSASGSLYTYIATVTQPHFTTDFPAITANDRTTATGLTSRDGFVGAFSIPPVPTTASLTPTLAFGSVFVGASSTQPLTFTNTSVFPSTVHVTGVSISGANASDFTQTTTCTSVTQSATCAVSVVFAPGASGARSATLTISSDSGAEPTLTAALTGNGLDTSATLAPAAATFPNTYIGAVSSSSSTFAFTNTSPLTLNITSIAASASFTQTSACPATLAPAATCSITVAFVPQAVGALTGTLTVLNSSTANGTLTAALSGTGVAALVASPSPLGFPSVDVGFSSAPETLAITNYTAQPIGLTSVTTSGDYALTSSCGPTLAAGATCIATLVFKPTATGARPGSLNIVTTYPALPLFTTPLTGNGTDFAIALSPSSGSVIAGEAVTFNALLTPLGGFNAPIALSCTIPNVGGTVCASLPATPTLSQNLNVLTTITTTAQYTVIGYGSFGPTPWLALLALLSAAAIIITRRRTLRLLALPLLLIALGAANLACSGKLPSRNATPTYPGAYTYTISATDGRLTHTAQYALTVTAR